MIIIKENEFYKKPMEMLKEFSLEKYIEMTEWEVSFLSGLIKKYKPKKLLEIGVSAGGSTAAILSCIEQLELETECYSIDVSKYYYRDVSKRTGFVAEKCKTLLQSEVKHTLFTGEIAPCFMDEIGSGIDFLFIDTMHIVPGEILDFLTCLPYLSDKAIVVLHDTVCNHIGPYKNSIATQLLLDAVTATKIFALGDDTPCGFPSIGAFVVNQDTKKYIDNVFFSLIFTWNYLPTDQQLKEYRDLYTRYYNDEQLLLFDKALELNRTTYLRIKQNKGRCVASVNRLVGEVQNEKKKYIYIYGCGIIGTQIYEILTAMSIEINGYVITDGQKKSQMPTEVYYLSEIEKDRDDCTIIVGTGLTSRKTIIENLKSKDFKTIIVPDEDICIYCLD